MLQFLSALGICSPHFECVYCVHIVDSKHKDRFTQYYANLDALIYAYEVNKSIPGNMTPGVTKETLDAIDLAWFEQLASRNNSRLGRTSSRTFKGLKSPRSPWGRGRLCKPRNSALQLAAIVEP
jgi:hypothetical protein